MVADLLSYEEHFGSGDSLKNVIFAVAAAFAAPSMAYAQTVPRYDPVAWCEAVAATGGGSSEMIKRGCLDQEQESYDRLKATWADVPAKSRRWCDEVARTGGHGSYMILSGCIDQETDSRKQNDTTEFKF